MFYVCPICSCCFTYKNEIQWCINRHIQVLRRMGYVITGENRNSADTIQNGPTGQKGGLYEHCRTQQKQRKQIHGRHDRL